jgi:hypothetical protein
MKKNNEFLLKTILIVLSLLILRQYIETKQQEKKDFYTFCSSYGFTEASIEQISHLEKPFVVKTVCGTVLRGDGLPMGTEVIFEIRKKDKNWKNQKIYKTMTDEKGNFCIKCVKRGTYCFKVTLEGWQSVMGEIILTDKADKNSKILIKLEPGF